MKPRIPDGLTKVFSTAYGIAGAIAVISGVIAFVTWATGIWPSVEDAVSDLLGYVGDFLNTDVNVWHLLLVVAGEVVAAAIIGAWVFRRAVWWGTWELRGRMVAD